MFEILVAIVKTGGGFFFSILFGALVVKIIAVMVGPFGVGIFSLLYQTQQTASLVGSYGNGTAIVQGLASRNDSDKKYFLSAISLFLLFGAFFVPTILIILSPLLGPLILGHLPYASSLIALVALPTFLTILLIFLKSIINGYRAIGYLAWVQVIVACFMAMLAYPAAILLKSGSYNVIPYLLSVGAIAGIAYAFLVIHKCGWLNNFKIRIKFDKRIYSSFSKFSMVTLLASSFSMGAMLVLRAIVANHSGISTAGIFDAAWTLSMTYVLLLLTSFGTYYMPSLSAIISTRKKVFFIKRVMYVSILLMIPLIVAVIVLKPLVITIFYSKQFVPALDVLRWMLIGDYLKITSWVLAFPMVAYAHMRTYFWTEFLLNVTLILWAIISLFIFNSVEGLGIGYVLNYVIYLLYTIYYASKKHKVTFTPKLLTSWFGGLGFVILISILTWNDKAIIWQWDVVLILLSVLLSFLMLKKVERRKIFNSIRTKIALTK